MIMVRFGLGVLHIFLRSKSLSSHLKRNQYKIQVCPTFIITVGEFDVEFPEDPGSRKGGGRGHGAGPQLAVDDLNDLLARLNHLLPPAGILPLTGQRQQHLHTVSRQSSRHSLW